MKVLLMNPPAKSSFVSPPLGLMYLASSLKKAGNEPIILDFLLKDFDKNLLIKIIEKGVDIITISAVTPLIGRAFFLADFIKKNFSKKTIVLGGSHATLMPIETLENCKSIDFIVKGEGEQRLNELIDYLEGRKKQEDLDGIVFRKDNKIIDLPVKKYIENLDDLPFPAWELVDIKRYSKYLEIRHGLATTLITSRGCPFQCTYCSKPIFGNYFRARSPENILAEMMNLKINYNIKEIVFYDDTFTLDRERVVKLCKLLIEKDLNIKWKCESRVNLVDEQLLDLMKRAGCYSIGYGIESGNQKILNILKKGIIIEQIEKAIRITKKAGIDTLGYFMLGIPSETEKEIKQTIAFSKKLNLDYAQFSIATAYPGTELYKIAKLQNKIPKNWSNSFYALNNTKEIISLCDVDSVILQKYLKKAYRSFYLRYSYIIKKVLGIKSLTVLKRYIRGLKILLFNV